VSDHPVYQGDSYSSGWQKGQSSRPDHLGQGPISSMGVTKGTEQHGKSEEGNGTQIYQFRVTEKPAALAHTPWGMIAQPVFELRATGVYEIETNVGSARQILANVLLLGQSNCFLRDLNFVQA
jgi:hypothetical protein